MALGRLMIQQQKSQCYASVYIKETRCPQAGSYMIARLAIKKYLLRYLSVLNQQHRACYSAQVRYLFSICMNFEFIWSDTIWNSWFQTSFFTISGADLWAVEGNKQQSAIYLALIQSISFLHISSVECPAYRNAKMNLQYQILGNSIRY